MNFFDKLKRSKPERLTPTFRKEPSSIDDPQQTTAQRINHDSVRDADPFSFESAYERLAWMFRLSVMTNVSLGAICIILGCSIFYLVPLKTTEIALVTLEPTSDHLKRVNPAAQVRITPITKDVLGYDLMFEAFVRRFTRLILEIDEPTHFARLQKAALFSDAKFWEAFKRDRREGIDNAMQSGLNRSITVETAEMISERKGIRHYAVEFIQTDRRGGKVIETRPLRAYVAVTARPNTVANIERYENPEGFRVLDFVLKERGNK